MKYILEIMKALSFIVMALGSLNVAAQTDTKGQTISIGGYALRLLPAPTCSSGVPSADELRQYLSQYDVEREMSLPIHSDMTGPRGMLNTISTMERERLKNEIRRDIVLAGLGYDSERQVVVRWMDFNMDGICDFSGPQLISSMRPITRIFLFRGLQSNKFELVSSGFEYLNHLVPIFPYVPIEVSGEETPLIVVFSVGGSSLVSDILQWNSKVGGFNSCPRKDDETLFIKKRGPSSLRSQAQLELCKKSAELGAWLIQQLPNKNLVERF